MLHSATGGGHQRVARTVEAALRARYGEQVAVDQVDALAEYAPWPLCCLPDWYSHLLWGGGRAYGLCYRLLDHRRRAAALSRWTWPWVRDGVRRLLRDRPADLVVAFHPVPVQSICRGLEEIGAPTPMVCVGTDLAVMHAFWIDPRVERYLVPTGTAQAQLLRWGVPADRVGITGLPIDRRIVAVEDRDPCALRAELGLDPERPLVLAMAGGDGFGPIERVVRAVAANGLPAQLAVIVGRNPQLRERLARRNGRRDVRVEGFVDNVHQWLRAADVLVTKAGPTTIAEAAALQLPMVLWGAIPAQETPNVDLVVERGAGRWAPRPQAAAKAVRHLLEHPASAAEMGRRAGELVQHGAGDRIARILWETAQASTEL
jgi:1,2-diacylglycerol 3-beta-galactosyltransferase